jgi:ribosomal protein S18 acetylase RimI-like enzyme
MIRTATPTDEPAVFQALMLAFSTDPAVRWTWPDPVEFMQHFPRFARAFAGNAFQHASADCIGTHGISGVALWLPPEVGSDDAGIEQALTEGLPQARQQEVFGLMDEMGRYHPAEPHWYLPLIGVDPFFQGQGQGAALLKHAMQRCDQAGQLAYLEATHPKSLGLYERHGFELLGRIQQGTSPTLFPMLRTPR